MSCLLFAMALSHSALLASENGKEKKGKDFLNQTDRLWNACVRGWFANPGKRWGESQEFGSKSEIREVNVSREGGEVGDMTE